MLRNFPHDYQLDSKDCGPACLKNIAKFYGKYFKLYYLRELCSITKSGVTFFDIAYAAEKIGFRSRSYAVDIESIKYKIPLPCVIHWEGGHFVVLYKVRQGTFYVSDPGLGLVKYSTAKFKQGWVGSNVPEKGNLLVLEPTREFFEAHDQKNSNSTSLIDILRYFTPYRRSFYTLFVVMFIVTGLQGLLPFISKAIIDVGIQSNDINFINIILFGNITIIVAMLIGNVVRDWILLHITSRVNITLISDYLIKLMKLPVGFFETKLIGDILQRASDHERVRNFIMNNSLNLFFSSITFLVFSIVLLTFHKVIFFIFLAGNLLYVLWVFGALRWRRKLDWETFSLTAQNQSYWVETITSIQDIKTNNYEMYRRWDWEGIQTKIFKVSQRLLTLNNIQNVGAQFITTITNLIITFYCAKAVIRGEITFGVMISTQFIIGMLSGPVVQFIIYIQSLQYAKISYERISEVHDLLNEEQGEADNYELPAFKSLVFRNVSFQYSPTSPLILKNLSFIVPEKKITAIVGDSGSGKSTLLKLLLRLYVPSHGTIQIGNMNIGNINLTQWRDKCASVLQDGKLFNDTIVNNIVLGGEVNYERLKVVVDTANIAKEIEEFPHGYNTMLGEMGRGLSGGQKQRLLIARALYKEPDYLFLDEATNSLDSVNEQKIVSALSKTFENRTVIVVAHRLSTIKQADQIIVLRNGSIEEIGNHATLMDRRGHYFNLVNAQLVEPAHA